MTSKQKITLAVTAGMLAMLSSEPSQALKINPAPMSVSIVAAPNLMVVVDDSATMKYGWLPDELGYMIPKEGGDLENAYYLYSPQINHQYFNPFITYKPWYNYKGQSCGDVDVAKVPTADNGALMMCQKSTGDGAIAGETIDLSKPSEKYFKATGNLPGYWDYMGDASNLGPQGADDNCPKNKSGVKYGYPNSDLNVCVQDSYSLVPVETEKDLQNFANWFVYYRFRGDAVNAAIGRAIANALIADSTTGVAVNPYLRMGAGRTTYTGTTDTGTTQPDLGGTVNLGVHHFTVRAAETYLVDDIKTAAIRKKLLYDIIYSPSWNGFTALTRAVDDVGLYFMKDDADGPWSNNPETGDTGTPRLECRRNYQMLLTDANANILNVPGDNRLPRTTVGNADDDPGKDMAGPPYQDAWSNTVADYAAYYWKTDLNPKLPDTVSKNSLDSATWQHLNTYTVGMGEFGTVKPQEIAGSYVYNNDGTPRLPTTVTWPDPNDSTDPKQQAAAKLDDIWHAAIDGRGGYFNTRRIIENNVDSLDQALSKLLIPSVLDTTASLTSLAYNNLPPGKGGVLYQARFRTLDWSGQLLAFPLDANANILDGNHDGVINAQDALWDADAVLATLLASDNAYKTRMVYSYAWTGPSSKVVFEFNSQALSELQRNSFDPAKVELADLISYLKGDKSKEKPVGIYRSRTAVIDGKSYFHPLGDIANSNPLYVGNTEDYGYSSLPADGGGGSYKDFLVNKKSRRTMVYFGANDGMLHGFATETPTSATEPTFDTSNVKELVAYVPGSLVNSNLSARSYDPLQHMYLVDGSPTVGDAFFGGAWHTILLGATGAGGKSIFALDVTNPEDFSESAKGTARVLWEFTNSDYRIDDLDLGYTMSQPKLVRLPTGGWGVIVGNGYNSNGRKLKDSDGKTVSVNGKPVQESLPVLYILDVSKTPDEAGFIIKKFSPCDNDSTACPKPGDKIGRDNGMSTPIVVDVNRDRIADYAYAGDLMGNLWKFDLTCPADMLNKPGCKDSWAVANGGKPLFTACDPNGGGCEQLKYRKPIISKPQVGGVSQDMANAVSTQAASKSAKANPSVLVYFGTGKYLDQSDVYPPPPVKSFTFYGLWDQNMGDASYDNSIASRGKLQPQTVLEEGTLGKYTVRITSTNKPCYTGKDSSGKDCDIDLGWYMDLPTAGERSIGFPLLLNGNVLFTTIIPYYDNCLAGGTGWLMELNAFTGARPTSPPFDLYGPDKVPDNIINSYDLVSYDGGNVPPSGRKSDVGMAPNEPALVPGNGLMNKFLGGSTGNIDKITDPGVDIGRMSWRQVR